MTDNTNLLAKRLTPSEREAARDQRLAAEVREAESPLAKFRRVWSEEGER